MRTPNDFQLLEARTGDVRVEMPWRRHSPWMNPHIVLSEPSRSSDGSSSEHITAVIGKNGTGKSHLLSAIVQTFVALEEFQRGRKKYFGNLPLEELTYRIDDRICHVKRGSRGGVEFRVDHCVVPIHELPLPRKVVALTISPFDKFPVPRAIRNSVAPLKSSIYQYLGLRDQFGKASIETILFRSLNSLFEESENEILRRINIGSVFEFLGLQSTLTVIYSVRISSAVRSALLEGRRLNLGNVIGDETQRRRIEEVLDSGMDEKRLRELLSIARDRSENGKIRTTANFEYGGSLDENFKLLQPLRRAGFLRITGVEVVQKDGLVSDLKRASSGQLSMVSALLALASVISNASLVLIDEPELSLHPEWQVDYVDLLIKTFSRFKGCHFIIATHSPMVISELPDHANIIALDRPDLPPTKEITGQSADYLLAEIFGTATPGNLYIRERIVAALNLVASGKAHSAEFEQALLDLNRLSNELQTDDPIRSVIANLADVAAQAGTEVT